MVKTRNLLKNFRFKDYLAIVSILGFFGIFINSIFLIDISGWIDGLLFIIIGIALSAIGGIQYFIKYFKGGLDDTEIMKILTIIVGVTSTLVGIFIFPIKFFEPIQTVPIVNGIKTIISLMAIFVIALDTWIAKK